MYELGEVKNVRFINANTGEILFEDGEFETISLDAEAACIHHPVGWEILTSKSATFSCTAYANPFLIAELTGEKLKWYQKIRYHWYNCKHKIKSKFAREYD